MKHFFSRDNSVRDSEPIVRNVHNVQTSPLTVQESRLLQLPTELIWELCKTFLAPEWRQTLITLSQVCRRLRYPAIKTYIRGLFHYHLIQEGQGQLIIPSTILSALPPLLKFISESAAPPCTKLVIGFIGSHDEIIEEIRHLSFLTPILPFIPHIDFIFKPNFPTATVQASKDFGAALKQGTLADICLKLLTAKHPDNLSPTRVTVVAGLTYTGGFGGFGSLKSFNNPKHNSRHLASSLAVLANLDPDNESYCQLRTLPDGAGALVIINGHTLTKIHCDEYNDYSLILPHIQLPALEKFTTCIGPWTQLPALFNFVQRHQTLRDLTISKLIEPKFCIGTKTPSFPYQLPPSIKRIKASPELITHLFRNLALEPPLLKEVTLDLQDELEMQHLETALKVISGFESIEILNLDECSRKLFSRLGRQQVKKQSLIRRFLTANNAKWNGTPEIFQGILYVLNCCIPGSSIAEVSIEHCPVWIKRGNRILVPSVVELVNRKYPQIELNECTWMGRPRRN
ncbi:hypothetical protein C8R44DRAFT_731666 [Mycena epipterygia]|nr:hypothetical protein C8R44DRAFT_731666 [Mycena epipterygia]